MCIWIQEPGLPGCLRPLQAREPTHVNARAHTHALACACVSRLPLPLHSLACSHASRLPLCTQSALLELKVCAIQQLEFEDVWAMFGEGRHPRIESIYERQLAPYLSQTSNKFWSKRLFYFKQGLYYQGGMVGVREGEGGEGY